jgi:lipid-binding SYLF domain-containing protein
MNERRLTMKYAIFAILPLTVIALYGAGQEPEKRIRESANVLNEIMAAKDKGIPEDLLEKARCVGVIPNLKRAGFVVGGKYGKGVVVCRTTGPEGWSAPETVRVEGGSIGFQIGAGETDVVFIVMNQSGMDKLMKDKVTLGADASAMAGPVGRSAAAQTDAAMRAEIVSWSRSRGIFGGVSLEGATLRPDQSDNHELYGNTAAPRDILQGTVKPPESAEPLYTALNQHGAGKRASK